MRELNSRSYLFPGWRQKCLQAERSADLETARRLSRSAVILEKEAVETTDPGQRKQFLQRAQEAQFAADKLNALALGIMPRRVGPKPLSGHSDPKPVKGGESSRFPSF
ncbi:MAG: hypothetical protein ABH867_01975 [Patescibacteria group bacterium]|nr:hypothetical protein [Patescibacteria group bacterium]